VHGVSRNAVEHLESFAEIAGGACAIVAPVFDEDRYPHYQKLGIGHDEPRADLALDTALAALSERTGLCTSRMDIFGFSGGAQFAHRYAMLHPNRIRSLNLAAAGYYTFLDEETAWPRGLRRAPVRAQVIATRRFFLRLPIRVYVGARDTTRDQVLRQGERIDAQQGLTRVDRARAWTGHLAALQAEAGFPQAELLVLPRCGHDFGASRRPDAGDLPRRVIAACGLSGAAVHPRLATG
jgi:pimeloyl-ACP methyl ester carboxylesterase